MRVVHPSVYLKKQERKRNRRPQRYAIFFLIIGLFAGYGFLAMQVKPEYTVSRVYPFAVRDERKPILWPSEGASAISYVGAINKVSASKNGQKRLPSASTIKLLTAVVVLNQKPLGPSEDGERIYFTKADEERTAEIAAQGGTVFPVSNGMSMSYKQALQAMLIASANNVAEKLAAWSFGSLDSYQKAAKSYMGSNDISATTVDDPSGLSPNTVTTADDLMKISILALQIPIIKEVVNTAKTEINGIVLTNTNTLLKSDNVDGAKTGYTPEAGNCLVLSKTTTIGNKDITFVAVLLGQPSRDEAFSSANALLNTMQKETAVYEVINRHSHVADIMSPWGQITEVEANTQLETIKWLGEVAEAKIEISPIRGTLKGDRVGIATLRDQDAELTLKDDLPTPSIWWRLEHGFDAIKQIL